MSRPNLQQTAFNINSHDVANSNTSNTTSSGGKYWTGERYKALKRDTLKPSINAQRRAAARASNEKLAQQSWRSTEKVKTVAGALIACLNIGVDPPDVIKPSICARYECWVDPDSMSSGKALRTIGSRLQQQYERWHEKAKYQTLLDPTADDIRKLCGWLRRAAADERALFHYNGHGVPRPTNSGEIWVYNKGYTQYIPISLYDIQTWLNPQLPAIYVFDCNNGGLILDWFNLFVRQRNEKRKEHQSLQTTHPDGTRSQSSILNLAAGSALPSPERKQPDTPAEPTGDDCKHILLASCAPGETLPVNPDLPADLLTACLTTPIKMALRWFCLRSPLTSISPSDIDKLPGIKKPSNRKQPFGELNWIFTSITDTIAYSALPRQLFHRLFRQDLLVASLFRNFLLAQRIFHSLNITAMSYPALPETHLHPMWQAWDLAADSALAQLERSLTQPDYTFTPSTFFSEQLSAFEIWLEFASERKTSSMQLPIVLQVLLSPDHRVRALQLLSRFLDSGSWAIEAALSVGIFPYVLRLLQSESRELRELLVFMWAKILSFDQSCIHDLTQEQYCTYFYTHLLNYRSEVTMSVSQHAINARGSYSSIGFGSPYEKSPSQGNNSYDSMAADLLPPPTTSYLQPPPSLHVDGASPPYQALPSPAMPHSASNTRHGRSQQASGRPNWFAPHMSPNTQPVASPMLSPAMHPLTAPSPLTNAIPGQELLMLDGLTTAAPAATAGNASNLSGDNPHALTRLAAIQLAASELQWTLALYIISQICHQNVKGQHTMLNIGLKHVSSFVNLHGQAEDPLLRRWVCLTVSKLWYNFSQIKSMALEDGVVDYLLSMTNDNVQEVRAAALYTLGTFMGGKTLINVVSNEDDKDERKQPPAHTSDSQQQQQQQTSKPTQQLVRELQREDKEQQICLTMIRNTLNDANHLVRYELVMAIAELVWYQQQHFIETLSNSGALSESPRMLRPSSHGTSHQQSERASAVREIWSVLTRLLKDPWPAVQDAAEAIQKYIRAKVVVREQYSKMMGGNHAPHVMQPTDADSVNGARSSDSSPQHLPRHTSGSQRGSTINTLPVRHFDRFAMATMRAHIAHPSVQPTSASHKRTEDGAATGKPSLNTNTDNDAKADSNNSDINARERDTTWTVPRSTIYELSCQHFTQPMLRTAPTANDAAGNELGLSLHNHSNSSLTSLSQLLQRSNALSSRQSIEEHAYKLRTMLNVPTSKTYTEVCVIDNGTSWENTSLTYWHPYDNTLYTADNKSTLSVWSIGTSDRLQKERLNRWHNDPQRQSRVSAVHLVDDTTDSMLIVGADDGSVRIWKNVRYDGRQRLVTSFNANPLLTDNFAPPISHFEIPSVRGRPGARRTNSLHDSEVGENEGAYSGHHYLSAAASDDTPKQSNGKQRVNGKQSSEDDDDIGECSDSEDEDGANSDTEELDRRRNSAGRSTLTNKSDAPPSPLHDVPLDSSSPSMVNILQAPQRQLSYDKPLLRAAASITPSQSGGLMRSSPSSNQLSAAMSSFTNAMQHGGSAHVSAAGQSLLRSSASTSSLPNMLNGQQSKQQQQQSSLLLKKRNRKPPLVSCWLPSTGTLVAAGCGQDVIRLWDVQNERCIASFPTAPKATSLSTANHASAASPGVGAQGISSAQQQQQQHVVTTVCSDHSSSLLYAGCRDGSVRLYDMRTSPSRAYVGVLRQHTTAVQSVYLQRGGVAGGFLVSTDLRGDVQLSDARMTARSVLRLQRIMHESPMCPVDAFACHEWAPLMASGGAGNRPSIEVFDINGNTLDTIRYHIGFLGTKLSSVQTLAFHPRKLLLASGHADSVVSIFAADKQW